MIEIKIETPARPENVVVIVNGEPIGVLKSIQIDESGVYFELPDDCEDPETRKQRIKALCFCGVKVIGL